MLTLYEDPCSGNCYKPRLLMSMLGKQFEAVYEDVWSPAHPTPKLKEMSPMGKVPVLVDDDLVIAESNAILCYLAKGTPFLPEDPKELAGVMQWMFFEQYYHEPTISVARKWRAFTPNEPGAAQKADACMAGGNRALAAMETHLANNEWFGTDRLTVADIALFGYTHSAEAGGFTLADYPKVTAWLARVKAHPGYVEQKW